MAYQRLQKQFHLQPNRFPLMPFWCLTMNMGKDNDCYGRVQYYHPQPTIHSYSKPHWHRILVPFTGRALSVREKARVQGFPDWYRFAGGISAQNKQIGNAVSPQLANAIARSILTAHLQHVTGTVISPQDVQFSRGLQNFREFLSTFDEAQCAQFQRHPPQRPPPALRVELDDMTFTELLVEYNTQTRTDHSTRYNHKTPFEVLRTCQDARDWPVEEILAMRREKDGDKATVSYLAKFKGFPWPEWQRVTPPVQTWAAYTEFENKYRNHDTTRLWKGGPCVVGDAKAADTTTAKVIDGFWADQRKDFDKWEQEYKLLRQNGVIRKVPQK
eukprot:TRINITY_DN13308_c0_g1_i1.p1 TRINITY_DN13308_c0_g1~~TRINITY_DN13308_c0_g1_i1.p1  ORF type:complete len:329 (+),score=66.15 TRINITY_DN13308_c0_g1_i1:495-1481(+)